MYNIIHAENILLLDRLLSRFVRYSRTFFARTELESGTKTFSMATFSANATPGGKVGHKAHSFITISPHFAQNSMKRKSDSTDFHVLAKYSLHSTELLPEYQP